MMIGVRAVVGIPLAGVGIPLTGVGIPLAGVGNPLVVVGIPLTGVGVALPDDIMSCCIATCLPFSLYSEHY